MKRKILIVMLIAICAAVCGIFAACETDASESVNGNPNEGTVTPPPPPAHSQHNYTETVIEPTCTENGYTLYKCECGDSYTDGVVEASGHKSYVVKGTPSTCKEHGTDDSILCSKCGEVLVDGGELPLTHHTEEIISGKEATCTEDGITEKIICSVCDEVILNSEIIPSVGHCEETTFGYDATCTEDGLKDGIYCPICNEVISEQEIIPAKGHSPETVAETPSTCAEHGWSAYTYCIDCNETIDAGNELPLLPHTEQIIPAIPASCAEPGYTEGKECGSCGTIISWPEQIVIPHTESILPAVEPSCTSDGWTEGKQCSVCLYIYEPRKHIERLEHTPETVPERPADCRNMGYSEFVHCSVCFTELTECIVTQPLGHDPVPIPAVPGDCYNGGLSEGSKCSRCPEILKRQEITPAVHAYEQTYDDFKHYDECSLCKKVNDEHTHDIADNRCTACSYAPDFTAGLEYKSFTSSYYVIGRGTSTDTHIRIPSSINGKAVLGFENRYVTVGNSGGYIGAFENETGITEVTIPAFEYIGGFKNCADLKTVNLAEGTKVILSQAFADCTKIKQLELPSSINRIDTSAFKGCTGLEKVNYDGDIAGWLNIEFNYLGTQPYGNPVYYSHNLYIKNQLLESLVIPKDVAEIKAVAFIGCESITEIVAENGLNTISNEAFKGCLNLQKLTLPSTITKIAKTAFEGCDAITYANLPATVYDYISKAMLETAAVNSGVKISDKTFENCTALKSLTLAKTVTEIGSYAFSGCTQLTMTAIPAQVTEIGSYAFSGCINAFTGELVFEDNINVYSGAFENCTGITAVTTGETYAALNNAFKGCVNLKTININSADFIGGFGAMTENQTDGIVINIGAKVKSIPENFLCANQFAEGKRLNVTEVNFSENSVCSTIGKRAFYGLTKYTKSITNPDGSVSVSRSFTIPDSVIEICDEAFMYCTSIESFYIPDTLEIIGNKAFYGCEKLVTLSCGQGLYIMPESIKTVGDQAFMNCTALVNAIYSEGLISIGAEAYTKCKSLNNVVLPRTLESLGLRAFGYDELGQTLNTIIRLTIPADVLYWTQQDDSGIIVRSINNLSSRIQELELTYSTYSYASSLSPKHTITDKDIRLFSNLKIIKLWDNIAKFEYNSFGCSKLYKIYFMASKAKWDAIEKDILWDNGMGSFNEVNQQVNLYCINNDGEEETYVLREAKTS